MTVAGAGAGATESEIVGAKVVAQALTSMRDS